MDLCKDGYHRLWKCTGQPIPENSSRGGYSRLDLLLVVAIIFFGGSLLILWLSRTTTQARRTRCEQKQLVLSRAIDVHKLVQGEFPGWLQGGTKNEQRKLSWGATILPWIGRPLTDAEQSGKVPLDSSLRGPRGEAFDRYRQSQATNANATSDFIAEFLCPEDPRMIPAGNERNGWMSYVVNAGKPDRQMLAGDEVPDEMRNGVFLDYTRDHKQRMTIDFIRDHDGESYTLLLAENIDAGLWSGVAEHELGFVWNDSTPAILAINQQAGQSDGRVAFARPSSRHLGGVNATFVGGNGQFLSEKIDVRVLQQMMTSAEGPASQEHSVQTPEEDAEAEP